MKEQLAQGIHNIIKGYRAEDQINITPEHIIAWADQFEEDSIFMLTELNHILPQIYITKEKAKEFILQHINWLVNKYGYQSISEFLIDTEFMKIQQEGKSQFAILELLEEVLNENWQTSFQEYSTFPKKNFVYFDDVLATGSTLGRHIVDWLSLANGDQRNIDVVLSDQYRLCINLFCLHTWGHAFQKYRLNKHFQDALGRKLSWMHNMTVENHARFPNQSYNHAFPVHGQPINVQSYLANLPADKYENYAYRSETMPVNERFFSSRENRIKYENILLQKGLSIINQIKGEIKPNIRPLGLINPTYKTFGLGTHFLTWRNIPNNCLLVYWWEVPGHDWIPLFPRKIIG